MTAGTAGKQVHIALPIVQANFACLNLLLLPLLLLSHSGPRMSTDSARGGGCTVGCCGSRDSGSTRLRRCVGGWLLLVVGGSGSKSCSGQGGPLRQKRQGWCMQHGCQQEAQCNSATSQAPHPTRQAWQQRQHLTPLVSRCPTTAAPRTTRPMLPSTSATEEPAVTQMLPLKAVPASAAASMGCMLHRLIGQYLAMLEAANAGIEALQARRTDRRELGA